MPSIEIEFDLENTSIPLGPLLTGIYRANMLAFMVAIIMCLLVMLAVGFQLAEKVHATLLELKVGQVKVLEALRAGPGAPRAAGCPDAD